MSRRLRHLKVLAVNDGDRIAKLRLSDDARARGVIKLDATEVAELISLLGVIALRAAQRNDALNEPLTDEMIQKLIEIAGEELRAEALISEALRK